MYRRKPLGRSSTRSEFVSFDLPKVVKQGIDSILKYYKEPIVRVPFPPLCLVTGPKEDTHEVGVPLTLSITIIDRHRRVINDFDDNIDAILVRVDPPGEPIVIEPNNLGDGKLTLRIVFRKKGKYHLRILYQGKEFQGSPWILKAQKYESKNVWRCGRPDAGSNEFTAINSPVPVKALKGQSIVCLSSSVSHTAFVTDVGKLFW